MLEHKRPGARERNIMRQGACARARAPGGLMRCWEGCAQDAAGDDEGNSKSKEKRRRKKEKDRQEQMVKEKEAKLLDAKHAPETAEEFERLVMSSPNSSFIWIKYMAFHLELTEIDKAREVRSS